MTSFSISGTSSHALTAGTTALYLDVTTVPSMSGLGRSNPTSRYDVGLIRFSDGIGYWAPIPIAGGPQWVGVPSGTTSIYYAIFGGGVVQVTEVIGGAGPFGVGGSTLSGLSDVSLVSVADGQVLEWVASASRWENRAIPGVSLGSTASTLTADVTMTTAGTDYDGPAITPSVGTWLILTCIEVYQQSNNGNTSLVVTDGTTSYSSTEEWLNNGEFSGVSVPAFVVTTDGTKTYTVKARNSQNGSKMLAHGLNVNRGNLNSRILGVQIG